MKEYSGSERSKNHRKPRSTKSKDYVDNDKLYDEMLNYKLKCIEAEKEGKEPPSPSNYIGRCIISVCERLATNHNFYGYTYNDEMQGDAIEACTKAINNYDPFREPKTKPFAYFTECAWWAMVQRIKKEKKYTYTKHKNIENIGIGLGEEFFGSDEQLHNKVIFDFEESEKRAKEKLGSKAKMKAKAANTLTFDDGDT